MPDNIPLRLATREEIEHTLNYGHRFSTNGKAHRHGDSLAAAIAASTLVDHLERSGYVLMKKPPARNTTPMEPDGPKRLTE